MSEVRVRSKTGCLTCKNRRKKCDEARPMCQRCKRAGMECLGYSYLDDPVPKPPRQKKRFFAGYSSGISHSTPSETRLDVLASEAAAASSTQTSLAHDARHMVEMWLPDPPGGSSQTAPEVGPITARGNPVNDLLWSEVSSHLRLDPQSSSTLGLLDTDFGTPVIPLESLHLDSNRTFNPSPGHYPSASLPRALSLHNDVSSSSSWGSNNFRDMTTEQASFFQALFSLGKSQNQTVSPSSSSPQTYSSSEGSMQLPSIGECDDSSSDGSEDLDTEGVMIMVGSTLALDRNIASNSLPYVISNFRWIIRIMFEPPKMAEHTKDFLIRRYLASDDLRYATTLVANIIYWLVNNPTSGEGFLALSRLQARIDHKIALVNANKGPPTEMRAHEALSALYEMEEMICVQSFSTTLAHTIRLHKSAALVYRYACSEPPDTPIHLPVKLLQPESTYRHFPAMDILLSLSTCQPMLFQYDVTPLSEPCELDSNSPGLQWMHGIPDQFLVMLAQMNMLREDSAPNVDPGTIYHLEAQISSFEPALDRSTDSYLAIARLTVQESWRQAMYIYLYMGLCGANSRDQRVEKALKAFIRILEGIAPKRTPDAFLIVPMIMAGVAARKKQNRATIQRRMLGIRDCYQIGTSGSCAAHILVNLWSLTDAMGRPAVWTDLQLAASRAIGIL
ncbi:hypothetical protein FRC12_009400 [Ceratobasidium sp. 428]|nr:hypothetical protein FRC12_009400 [Ceratobasidium sp. 428]